MLLYAQKKQLATARESLKRVSEGGEIYAELIRGFGKSH